MLPLVAPRAVIELAFDPVVRVGDWSVRWETLAVAAVVFLALGLAALVARSTPVDLARPPDAPGAEPGELNRLRADDLLYIAVAALPGAVIGGRLGYALLHRDAYAADPALLLDVTQGSLQLPLGVVGGLATASIVAAMLGAPLGRWLHALALPVLLAIAGGKAAMALGGTGQGALTDASWATAYTGPGPWGSLAPALPSHPSQLYEAGATLGVVLLVLWFLAFGAFPGRRGGAMWFAIGSWAVARALVATTWRDPQVLGELRMDQLISIGIAIGSFLLVALLGASGVVAGRRARRAATDAAPDVPAAGTAAPGRAGLGAAGRLPGEPDWPDPSSRPRI